MSTRVRALLFLAAGTGAGSELIADAYHRVSSELAGTAGLLGNELLRCRDEPDRLVVLSEWASLADFQRWERTAGHRAATAPLRPFQEHAAPPRHGCYEVVATHH
ncbi:antibiotic biosynthesis monooxygenase family protein [Actinoplanes sp. CA-051413]|uniref:antibiotic biosynthesis monooxygenase family protein n=1 Tax=Actinoplanes sp. CA-051413 TaxID=3239899 RepID=UPI003D99BF2D